MARKPPGKGHPARPSCRAASPRRRPAAPAPPTHPGTGPQSRAALGWFSVTKHWKPLPGTSRGSAQEGGPSGNVWQPVSPGRGSRAGASRVLPDGPSASSRRDPIWPASSEARPLSPCVLRDDNDKNPLRDRTEVPGGGSNRAWTQALRTGLGCGLRGVRDPVRRGGRRARSTQRTEFSFFLHSQIFKNTIAAA